MSPRFGVPRRLPVAPTLARAPTVGASAAVVWAGATAAVPPPQWEAAVALNLTRLQPMRRVILPQALPEMIPPFGNLWIQILKSSSVLFLLSITELTFEVGLLRREIGSTAAYGIALVLYFVMAQALVAVTRRVERRAAARLGRSPTGVAVRRRTAVGT